MTEHETVIATTRRVQKDVLTCYRLIEQHYRTKRGGPKFLRLIQEAVLIEYPYLWTKMGDMFYRDHKREHNPYDLYRGEVPHPNSFNIPTKPGMSFEAHTHVGYLLSCAYNELTQVWVLIANRYPRTGPNKVGVIKQLGKVLHLIEQTSWQLDNALWKEHGAVIPDYTIKHIYSGGYDYKDPVPDTVQQQIDNYEAPL